MALPTASTPGFTAYPGVLYGPDVACSCLARWLYLFRKLCVAKGLGDPAVWQLTGGNSLSGGTHSLGGVYDLGGVAYARSMLAREAGAVDWGRNWTGNVHSHGIIACPHNDPAAYQRAACIVYRRDGLGYMGLAGPDPLPPPSRWRTYDEGIDWMKAELSRLNSPAQEEISVSDAAYIIEQNKAIAEMVAYVQKQVKAVAGQITAEDAEDDAQMAQLLAAVNGVDEAVWATTVRRGDASVPVIQEIADAKTHGLRVETGLSGLGAKVDSIDAAIDAGDLDAIKAAVAELRTVVEDAHPKAEPQPEPVPALGIDVSRYQTIEQSAAALAAKPDFCIINASTGLRAVSPALASHTTVAREHADVTGFYHWSNTVNDLATTPDKSDPVGEAAHFLATCKPQPGDVLALDHEEALGTWPQRVAYALAWLDEVKARTGATPLLYVNWSWVKGLRTAATLEQWERLTAYPLWLADYSGTPGKHDTVTAKDGSSEDDWPILLHQYAITDDVDRDFCHDLNRLRACAVP
ncbi:MAG TPA: GH25 family lysozyme [Nocardioidaceae bacterium]